MSYDNNEPEYEPAQPKKADVLIKSTQTIVSKQEELSEQTKLAISRIDEAIELCHKNSEEASYILDHSTEMFEKLQAENSALKQELLYLAKQSENIYTSLAEKLTGFQNESAQQAQPTETAPDANYYELADRLAEIYDRLAEMTARIDALSAKKEDDALNDKFAILYDKIDAVAASAEAKPVQVHSVNNDNAEILDKLNRIMDNMRKNEGAHSMLADKFEILSMRVEQFGFESAKPQSHSQPAPAAAPAYPAPAPVQAQVEIDYDKLASKVADILTVRETVSPDYIASKVAEQIVLPGQDASAEIDTGKIAEEVAALINEKTAEAPFEFNEDAIVDKLCDKVSEMVAEVKAEPIDEEALANRLAEKLNVAADGETAAPVEINEEALAERIAERLNVTVAEGAVAPVEINEEVLADRIAEKLNVVAESEVTSDAVEFDDDALVEKIVSRLGGLMGEAAPVNAELNIDQEDLADMIALKVGSLKPEDFEILVDDAGCASISKEIAEKIDYNMISTIIADKLREILDLNIANAPDYEDMAERISEKITVAGINEDAIAEKAAAVLSNYLPEFDTEEIADKVTGAVIDVVSAMPQPTLDSEAICNEISERLIEKQEDNNYDIVIDDEGISRITAIVTEEIEKDTDERFDKLEESIAKITEMLTPEEVEDVEEEVEETEEVEDDEITEEEMASLSETIATEIEKGTAPRFDKVEEDIARIYELVSNMVVEEGDEVEYDETEEAVEYEDADYSHLSEIVASEIEKGVSSRLDSVEEKLDSLTEMLTVEEEDLEEVDETEEVEELEDGEEVYEEDVDEEEYAKLSEMFAQMESDLSTRFEAVEEKITSLTDLMTEEVEEVEEEEYEEGEEVEEEYAEDAEEDEYAKLSEIVSARFDSVEEKITNLTELIAGSEEENVEEYEEATEEDYNKLSEIVAAEIEKSVTARFDSVDENIRKINAIVGGLAVAGTAASSGNVEADIRLYEQFDKVTDDIRKISEYVQGDVPVVLGERLDKISGEIAKISQLVEGEISVETTARLDKLQEEIEKLSSMPATTVVDNSDDRELLERVEGGVDEIKGMLIGGVITSTDETAAAQTAEVEEEEELVTVSDLVKPIGISIDDEEEDDDDGDFLLSAIDMDKFSDDEHMPGELGDLDGVDFENMMKYNRSFIARIIQSDDDCKQYYGAVKHALLSYKKVNSNVAWGNERFNKGRETIARMKIRGKTLVIYLALDPNEYKTSVYHHVDVSDNKSVLGTPMMIKVKSPLGVRKAIRLIDEMLEKRNGEKRELPERDYAAMYPYETIEELIEDGLVKDVRKK
ncbi:MAG: hypothetical protein K2N23_08330 [Clostridia bacterium]|nr:hypothetical protein [Clostridia bacterium]